MNNNRASDEYYISYSVIPTLPNKKLLLLPVFGVEMLTNPYSFAILLKQEL